MLLKLRLRKEWDIFLPVWNLNKWVWFSYPSLFPTGSVYLYTYTISLSLFLYIGICGYRYICIIYRCICLYIYRYRYFCIICVSNILCLKLTDNHFIELIISFWNWLWKIRPKFPWTVHWDITWVPSFSRTISGTLHWQVTWDV